jgi:methylated-DNA-[protein]-cysteine S-methyltransferase
MSLHPPEPTPGQAAALAARTAARAAERGLADVAYATVESPLGRLVAVATRRGLARLAYELPNDGLDTILERVAVLLSPRIVEAPAQLEEVRRELDEYFAGRRERFDVALDWSLVSGRFGRRVLEQTARIPFGATRSYREIAERSGSPAAFRAAGNALGANPIPIIVPCHRVLASGGGLGGYTGGLAAKRRLLAIEGRSAGE